MNVNDDEKKIILKKKGLKVTKPSRNTTNKCYFDEESKYYLYYCYNQTNPYGTSWQSFIIFTTDIGQEYDEKKEMSANKYFSIVNIL